MKPIHKVLIANRGEIASRVIRTCRDMGLETVAVHSDADADAPFVREADEAVRIGPPPSAESYLVASAILEAAARTGADAVHPGFGFLAENADFAREVLDAGLTFVGPGPDAIRAMGSKQRAKQIARDAGVPVIEGYDGEAQDLATFRAEAARVGYPVLLKASAGGGGKGMRVVRSEDALEDALASAKREAASSFGDDAMLLEKYLERPRHIEIQILGDAHGAVIHLGERECSIQRRHQKVVEEAPSVAVDDALRARMGEAAVSLAKAIGYRNAGTVEMILDASGDYYFLEVNTRLQVEHPVTEAIFDLDLVELQLRIARGEPLPLTQDEVDLLADGAAIECRIYAEDPSQGFLPQTGTLARWSVPEAAWLRVDAGVETGSAVSIHYDPMLAKVIAWGERRADAVARMRWALRRLVAAGVTTNRDFLLRVLEHEAFAEGALHTHFIDEHLAEPAPPPDALVDRAAIAAALHAQAARAAAGPLPSLRSGFRNNRFAPERARFVHGERGLEVAYVDRGEGRFDVTVGEGSYAVERRARAADEVRLALDGHAFAAQVCWQGAACHVLVDGAAIRLEEEPRFPELGGQSAADGAFAPMPGKIVEVRVAAGDAVSAGQTLLVMEAMKMEHAIGAPHDGVVAELRVTVGEQVEEGATLAVIREAEE